MQHCRSMTIKNKYTKRRRKLGPLSLEITEGEAGCVVRGGGLLPSGSQPRAGKGADPRAPCTHCMGAGGWSLGSDAFGASGRNVVLKAEAVSPPVSG